MMMAYTIFRIISIASIFYTFIKFIFWVILKLDSNATSFLYYNVNNDLFWYLLYYFIPILLAVFLAIRFKDNSNLYEIGKFFVFVLFVLTILGSIVNKNYWGYYFKRPSTFSELKNANEILSITQFGDEKSSFKIINETNLIDEGELVSDFYYFSFERPIFTMLSKNISRGNLSDWNEIYKSPKAKLTEVELKKLDNSIRNSEFIDIPEYGYEESLITKGIAVEFVTSSSDNTSLVTLNESRKPLLSFDKKFVYVLINSGQISNDHFGVYEFLFQENQIIKKNKYYYDVAGLEGIEYPVASPIIELIFLFFTLFVISITKSIKIILLKKKD